MESKFVRPEDKHIVLLYSGGLDSFIMGQYAREMNPKAKITKVFFDIGAPNNYKEREILPPDVEVLDMKWFCQGPVGKDGNATGNIFIPGRNMVFATIAASKYLPDEIWLGALCGEIHESATDKNLYFNGLQNDLLKYVLSPFKDGPFPQLVFPFVDRGWGKLDITKLGVEYGLADQLVKTRSCLSDTPNNCGRCAVCARRRGIFMQLGLKEEYDVEPFEAVENAKMLAELVSEDYSHYDQHRKDEIVPALLEYHPTKTRKQIEEYYRRLAATANS